MVQFDNIKIDRSYDRPTLAHLWGYQSFHAFSKGVFTPKGQGLIILFVTRDKQSVFTQYEDHIEQDILFWEGEDKHGSDRRIISEVDIIHVFYRNRHHSDFIYKGKAKLRSYKLFFDRPSKFSFWLTDKKISIENIVHEIQETYSVNTTEKEAIIKSRIGQGNYRDKAFELWGSCSVTNFSKKEVLIASHIKPWKVSSNQERINPYNSLILVPTLDKLFDKGYIGFNYDTGKILLTDRISDEDWNRIGIYKDMKLKIVPKQTVKFLEYHTEYVFDLLK